MRISAGAFMGPRRPLVCAAVTMTTVGRGHLRGQ
ncbi:hypothetical protein Ae168Ps1_0084 [Pseudonocardia sp. Ae168_Ps1]|nr:hypothetical protein Ae150APs1_0081 [Pseudonocardia sp. Ae150A_Ps1]OLL77678.1 hypothetical protein Ae168Ps1_0084 [Pseudonocardia sp. Ae168_Ps1]OLL88199.1 hypothetical protein Ae263Ps1_5254c [Pseudonocardia sp. Ae263_Ps1]OLL91771.1 hypothetical protein Ae356Ps1_1668 [Pseudonocardia sp. Ae356_Ps1]